MPIADCVTPPQAIEMTTESQNPETTAVHMDWVVSTTNLSAMHQRGGTRMPSALPSGVASASG
jgi:hypothetical protein